ncbi:MAG: hypothetical protein QM645_00060 [Asticcacaulis sp.]
MTLTAGAFYARASQMIAQDSGRLAAILVLTYSLPTLTFQLITLSLGDNTLILCLGYVADFTANTLAYCLMAYLLEARLKGKPFSAKDSFRRACGRLLPVFGTTLLTGLIVGISTLLLIIPGVIALLGLCLTVPACVLEKKITIDNTLSRSWELTRNNWLTIAVIYLTVLAIIGLILFGFYKFYYIFGLEDAAKMLVMDVFLLVIISSIFNFMIGVCSIVIYLTLREAKEGHTPEVTAAVFD